MLKKNLLRSFLEELTKIICGDVMDNIFKIQDKIAKYDKVVAFYVTMWITIEYIFTLLNILENPAFLVNFIALFMK
ncbi:hypothetical protein AALD22_26870 [Lachnospiraceae bacterium 56-18]